MNNSIKKSMSSNMSQIIGINMKGVNKKNNNIRKKTMNNYIGIS